MTNRKSTSMPSKLGFPEGFSQLYNSILLRSRLKQCYFSQFICIIIVLYENKTTISPITVKLLRYNLLTYFYLLLLYYLKKKTLKRAKYRDTEWMSVNENTQRCSSSQQWGIWKSRSNQSKRSDGGIHPSAHLSRGLGETPSAWQLSSAGEELIAEGLVQLHYPSMLRLKHGAILLLDHFSVTFRHNTLELEVWLFGPTND